MKIQIVETEDEIRACFPVVRELRTHLEEDEFVRRVLEQQTGGYAVAAVRDDAKVRAVAGYRIFSSLAWGKVLYVDDLVTAASERSRGHGKALLNWLQNHARAAGCEQLHLDSGVEKTDAHRFYFRERMVISSYHFKDLL